MKFKIELTDRVLPGCDTPQLRLSNGRRMAFRRTAVKKEGDAPAIPKVTSGEADLELREAQDLVACGGYKLTPDPFDAKTRKAAAGAKEGK